MTLQIPPERFKQMSRALFDAAIGEKSVFNYMDAGEEPCDDEDMKEMAGSIGRLAGLAWLAHEAGEAAEREET